MLDGAAMITPIDIEAQFAAVTEYWSPRIVGRVNDQYVKIAKAKGEFVWHAHDREDELFLIVRGELRIELEDGELLLGPGQLGMLAEMPESPEDIGAGVTARERAANLQPSSPP